MSHNIEELKSELREIREFRERIFDATKAWYAGCEQGNINTHEFGETIDIIKDLAEAEKECAEACYYMSIVKAMAEAEEYDEEMEKRFGYNPNRYKSSGRFASAGHGTRMGYPRLPIEMWGPLMERYGYPVYYDGMEHDGKGDVHTGYGDNASPEHRGYVDPDTEEYGRDYSRYRMARRHYTETKDPKDKTEMDKHAMEHFGKALHTFKDIWQDVQPEQKKAMKRDLEKLVSEMNI